MPSRPRPIAATVLVVVLGVALAAATEPLGVRLGHPAVADDQAATSAPVASDTIPAVGSAGPVGAEATLAPRERLTALGHDGPVAQASPPRQSHRRGHVELDLYADRDFVPQATVDFCVPATIATIARIMTPGDGGPTFGQHRLYRLARRHSTSRLRGPGAEPEGMARTLDQLGLGPYLAASASTRTAAIRLAARALRTTGRPVALFVWRGAHAWVMSGFRATADPASTARFRVTHLRVEDVWYPRISSIWGRSRRPDTLVPVEAIRDEYLPWHRPLATYAEKDGRYVLVIPVG